MYIRGKEEEEEEEEEEENVIGGTILFGMGVVRTILQTHYSYNILPGVFSKQKRRETRVIIVHINRIHLIL